MQADRVQVLAQQAAAGNVEAFVVLVQEFAPDLRLLLAAHIDQPTALASVESAVWSAVRSRLGEFIGDPPFASWIQSVAIDPLTAHLTQADRRAVDIQDALAHQNIQACHEALADGCELQVAQVRHRLAALPETTRALLMRRYRDRQRPSDIAANLMISESELAISLATARAYCDWRELARPPAAGDRLLPPLIEDWLNQTIDVDSRALLATNLGRDHERAAQFARQVRVHLALGACLAPFTREDAASLVRQSGLGVGDSGRVMIGDGGARPSAVARPAGSDARRPARMATSNRQVVPFTDDTPRPSPMPWIIGGGMVLVGVAALMLLSQSGTSPTRAPLEPALSAPSPQTSPQSSLTPPSTAGSSALRPQPIPQGEPKVMLVGVTAGTQVYTGIPFELRALVSGIPDLSEVEYWIGNQRLGTAREIPFSLKWTPSQAGPVEVQVRAMIGAVTKVSSQPLSLTVMKANGNGQFTREWWSGVPGAELGMGLVRLNSNTAPTGRSLESQFSAPRNWEDSYLQRLSGYLIPPADGDYIFWIAADNEAELWLSTDESYAKRSRIAVAPYIHGGAIPYQAWDHDTRQRSAPIRLRAGQRYYCEAIHKEGGGDDYVDVGWQLPDGTLQRPIPGIHLMPAPPAPTPDRSALPPLSVTLVPPGRVYQHQPLVLRATLSHTADVTAVEFWIGDERVASVTQPFTWTWEKPTVGMTSFTLRAVGAAGTLASSAPTMVAIDQTYGSGTIRREWWTAVEGWVVAEGVVAPGYPGQPHGTADETIFSAPRDWGNSYFQRMHGFIVPPYDGEYVFWIASDDDGELWLSTDDQRAGLRRIAWSPRIPDFGIQPNDWEHQPSQRSSGIVLKRGQRYYVEVLHKEGTGEDHLSVGWRLPDGSLERPIPGVHLSLPTPAVSGATSAPPVTLIVPTTKVVRAINLGGETTEVDGVRMLGHRQAEADGASPATSHQPGPWLSDLNWVRGNTGSGEIRRNRSMEDKPITIDGKVYAKGLGVHANSEVVFALDGRQSGFTAIVGVDDEAPAGELIFQVWLDHQKVWESGIMRKGMAKPVALPLAGRKELRLVVDSNGPFDWDHADWANAQFLVPGGDDGALQVQNGRRATATFTPKPAVDAKTRALLSTALVGTKEGLAFRVKVANGPSRVWLWIAENGAANSRQFDLSIEGVTLAGVGLLPANGWEKLGPIEVNVADGTIDVAATVLKGIPQVMGILVEQTPPAPTPVPVPVPAP